KVGIFATIVLLLLAWFVLKIEDLNPFGPKGEEIYAVFDSVAGLDDRSAVRVAGVRVGTVDGIDLADDNLRARVRLRLDRPLGLTEGTHARISSLGLLGDKYVELVPGGPGAPELPEQAVIPGVNPPSFDEAMATLNEVADSILGVTDPLGLGLTGQGEPTPVSRLIGNLEATSAEIRLLIESNRGELEATIANFETFSASLARELPALVARMESLLGTVDAVVAENRDELGESAENAAELTRELKAAARDLSAIAGRLERGEGTIGKLLTSDQAHDELVTTLDSVQSGIGQLSDTLGRVNRIRLDLDMRGFYLPSAEESYGSLGLTLLPDEASDKLYRVGIAQTPRGDTRTKTEEITVTLPDGSTEKTVIETFTREDEAVLTALLGLRLDNDMRLWAGLVEESFGVEVETPFLDRRFWLDVKAFDFDRPDDRSPHLRLSGRYHLNDNIYLIGGYDDPLESDLDSLFLGGGIRWTDDNLKYLLGSIPLGGL
ncbi:MAG TPA: MlaD family protein, partial [Thermoanaerobaculia bacterium]|nr:MlaD family protein [Thermoanaerobaculia bacterium]